MATIKASGNTINASIVPYAPLRQKIVAAITSGEVPDLFQNTPPEITALYAWDDKLVDVSDVVETQRKSYSDTAIELVNCYNNVTKRRNIYGVPYSIDVFTNHIWRSLVEKAGYKMDDIPKTWDAFYDFFKGVQTKLRDAGMRRVYGLGFQVTTNGGDPNAFVDQWLIAYGGQNVVGRDGKLNLNDPMVREAAMKAITYPTTAYKQGFVPPSAINWNDADDNNAFHAKTIVMDLDGSISTEVAIIKKKDEYDDVVTGGWPTTTAASRWRAGRSASGTDPERREKRRSREGFPEVSDSAGGVERISEDGARSPRAGNAVDRQK